MFNITEKINKYLAESSQHEKLPTSKEHHEKLIKRHAEEKDPQTKAELAQEIKIHSKTLKEEALDESKRIKKDSLDPAIKKKLADAYLNSKKEKEAIDTDYKINRERDRFVHSNSLDRRPKLKEENLDENDNSKEAKYTIKDKLDAALKNKVKAANQIKPKGKTDKEITKDLHEAESESNVKFRDYKHPDKPKVTHTIVHNGKDVLWHVSEHDPVSRYKSGEKSLKDTDDHYSKSGHKHKGDKDLNLEEMVLETYDDWKTDPDYGKKNKKKDKDPDRERDEKQDRKNNKDLDESGPSDENEVAAKRVLNTAEHDRKKKIKDPDPKGKLTTPDRPFKSKKLNEALSDSKFSQNHARHENRELDRHLDGNDDKPRYASYRDKNNVPRDSNTHKFISNKNHAKNTSRYNYVEKRIMSDETTRSLDENSEHWVDDASYVGPKHKDFKKMVSDFAKVQSDRSMINLAKSHSEKQKQKQKKLTEEKKEYTPSDAEYRAESERDDKADKNGFKEYRRKMKLSKEQGVRMADIKEELYEISSLRTYEHPETLHRHTFVHDGEKVFKNSKNKDEKKKVVTSLDKADKHLTKAGYQNRGDAKWSNEELSEETINFIEKSLNYELFEEYITELGITEDKNIIMENFKEYQNTEEYQKINEEKEHDQYRTYTHKDKPMDSHGVLHNGEHVHSIHTNQTGVLNLTPKSKRIDDLHKRYEYDGYSHSGDQNVKSNS